MSICHTFFPALTFLLVLFYIPHYLLSSRLHLGALGVRIERQCILFLSAMPRGVSDSLLSVVSMYVVNPKLKLTLMVNSFL